MRSISSLPIFRPAARTVGLSLLLVSVIVVVYRASVRHFLHSDQWVFLLDTIEHHRFFDLVAHSYSYNRTRLLRPGDTQLFRPLFFVWLSGLQAFLGTRFELIQGLGIVLHAVVCVQFFLLLRLIFARVGQVTNLPSPRSLQAIVPWDKPAECPRVVGRIFNPSTPTRVAEKASDPVAGTAPPASMPACGRLAGGVVPRTTGSGPFSATTFAWLPFAMAFFYALNYALAEQVIWYNIQPYLVAVAAILGAILLLGRATETPARRRGWYLTAAWMLTLLATFTYELGQFLALCAGLFLVCTPWSGWRRRLLAGVAFVAITVTYQGINHYDRWVHTGSYTDDVQVVATCERACDVATVKHFARYGLYVAVQPFLPCRIQAFPHGKLRIDEYLWFGRLAPRPTQVFGWVVVGLWASLSVAGAARLLARRAWRELAFGGLLAGVGLAQAVMIVVGRMNLRGDTTLPYNSHYTYVGLLFALAVSAVAIAHAQRLRSRFVHVVAGLLAVGMIALGSGSAVKVERLNTRMAVEFRPVWRWMRSLRKFVDAHAGEPDFRFAVAWNPRATLPQTFAVPVPYLFYLRHVDRDHPTYVLWYQEDNRFVGIPVEEWRRRYPEGGPHFCPDFVHLGARYQVFSGDGLYYAVDFSQVWPFLACPRPELAPEFHRDRDLASILEWIRQATP